MRPEAARRHRGDDEQRQQRAHAVVGKALPQLGEEQRREAARLACKNSRARRIGAPGGYGHRSYFAPRVCFWFSNIPRRHDWRQAILQLTNDSGAGWLVHSCFVAVAAGFLGTQIGLAATRACERNFAE